MPIPDYQTLMLPLLRLLENGEEHTHAEVRDALANYYSLTPEERSQLVPSGRQFLFDNRLHWARSYLKNARLVESTGRAKFRITDRGRELLGFNPPKITNHLQGACSALEARPGCLLRYGSRPSGIVG